MLTNGCFRRLEEHRPGGLGGCRGGGQVRGAGGGGTALLGII